MQPPLNSSADVRTRQPDYVALSDEVGNDLAFAHDFDGAGTWGHQFLVGIDAELVVDGEGEIAHLERIILRLRSEGVGGTVDHALLKSAASEDDAEDFRPVIAAAGGVDLRRAAEFRRNHDERAFEQAAFAEIADEASEGLAEITHQELAERTGTVREIAGRALRQLAQEGLVHLERGRVIVLDRGGLARIVDEH